MCSNLSSDLTEKISLIIAGAIPSLLVLLISNIFNKRNLSFQSQLSEKINNKKINLEKLERLYMHLDKWRKHLDCIYLDYTKCMDGKLSYKQVLDLHIESSKKVEFDYSEIKMIFNIYFPDLITHFKQIEIKRENASKFIFELRKSIENNKNSIRKDLINPFLETQHEFDKQCETTLIKISEFRKNILL